MFGHGIKFVDFACILFNIWKVYKQKFEYIWKKVSQSAGKHTTSDIAQCPVFPHIKEFSKSAGKLEKKTATELPIEGPTLLDFINLSYSKCHGTYSKCLAFLPGFCQGLSQNTVTMKTMFNIYVFLKNREKISFLTCLKFCAIVAFVHAF